MFTASIPPIKKGDTITASWLERVRKAAIAALNITVEAPLDLVKISGGYVLRLALSPEAGLCGARWIRITSGSQPYAWTGLDPVAHGLWQDNADSGTTSVDPAWEQNASTAVPPGTVVLARRTSVGDLVFQLGPCATNQPAPIITPGKSAALTEGGTVPPVPPFRLALPDSALRGGGGAPVASTDLSG